MDVYYYHYFVRGNRKVNSKYSIFMFLMRTDDSSFSSTYWQWKAINIIQVKTRQWLFEFVLHFWFLSLISPFFSNLETIKLNFLVIDGRQIDISSQVLACDGQHSFEMQISQDSVTFKLNDNERKPGYCLCMRTDLLDAVRIKSPYIITYY